MTQNIPKRRGRTAAGLAVLVITGLGILIWMNSSKTSSTNTAASTNLQVTSQTPHAIEHPEEQDRVSLRRSSSAVGKTDISSLTIPELTVNEISAATGADADLQSVLNKWLSVSRSGKELSENDAADLHRFASKTMLPAPTLLAVARCIKRNAPRETLLLGLLASRAGEIDTTDLTPYAVDTREHTALVEQLMAEKALLWFSIQRGNPQFVPTQLAVCEKLSRSEICL